MLDRLVADDLVASLLLVHGLHPHDVRRRVCDALDQVRPYLGSHGGDVHLLDIVGDTVQLQFAGSCKSCPSSAVTLELAVEDAIRAAAPEISSIEVVAREAAADEPSAVIPTESLLARPCQGAANGGLGDLASGARPGRPGSRRSRRLLGCRRRGAGLPGRRPAVRLPRSLPGLRWIAGRRGAAPTGRGCATRCCDVRAVTRISTSCTRGRALTTAPRRHLDPIPLLVRDGVLSIAVPAEPIGAPA